MAMEERPLAWAPDDPMVPPIAMVEVFEAVVDFPTAEA